jgi:hypothetical protein
MHQALLLLTGRYSKRVIGFVPTKSNAQGWNKENDNNVVGVVMVSIGCDGTQVSISFLLGEKGSTSTTNIGATTLARGWSTDEQTELSPRQQTFNFRLCRSLMTRREER